MGKIFVTRAIPEAGMKMLHDAFGEENVSVNPVDEIISREDLLKSVKGADALFVILTEKIDDAVLDAAGPQLQIVANMAVGYNNVDVEACTKRGIPVTNTPGVLTETTADLVWALMLATARRTTEAEVYLRDGQWTGWGPLQFVGSDVFGKTLGIFGMGRIGQAVAKRALGFDMKVIYHSRNQLGRDTELDLNAHYVDKDTLVAESDYLSIHCPLSDETRHAFGAAEFKAMKNTATLINTSRGPVVDEGALAEALSNGVIARAGLDVFEEEPKVHPALLTCDNACILPHIGSATIETRSKMATMTAENIIARLNGKRPPNCVNPEVLG